MWLFIFFIAEVKNNLPSDTAISIYTEWFDADGSPLPDSLEGFTGRLAKVTAPNSLEGGRVNTFKIKPGANRQVLKLKGDILGTEHFYVHVFGTPDWDVTLGAGSGPLQYRPDHYVPIRVPIFDEAATQNARNSNVYNQQDNQPYQDKVAAIYRWPYRPEMQFSVFDLQRQQLQFESTDGSTQLIDLTNPGENVLGLLIDDDLRLVDLLYDLPGSLYDPLAPFGPERGMIFAIGAEEALATITPGGKVRFENPAHLALLDSSDLLSIRLYQNSDMENVLWELALGSGLDVTSSSDPDSAAARSFIICDSNDRAICEKPDPITLRIVGDFADDAQVEWTIEALEYVPPTERDTPVNADETLAYGQPKDIKVGRNLINIPAVGTGTGKFGDPWVSFAQNFSDIRSMSFLPDLSAGPHTPEIYQRKRINGVANPLYECSGQYDTDCINGTNLIDMPRHNPHVGYKVTATVKDGSITQSFEATVKMDHKDTLRQEYINHKESIKTISLNTARTIPVPDRKNMILTSSVPTGFVEKLSLWSDYQYEYTIVHGMKAAWEHIDPQFNQYLTNNPTITGVGGATVTMPTNTSLRITSGFRNPERQERLGSVICSKHMFGNALDISPTPVPRITGISEADKLDRALKFYALWRSVGASPPTGQVFYQLELPSTVAMATSTGTVTLIEDDVLPGPLGDGVPDVLWQAGHLHLHVSAGGNCP